MIPIASNEKLIVIDVGGQRSERRKWAMCFHDITCLIFFTAISEYDVVLYEDVNTNRMMEAIKLFSDICSVPYFTGMPLILFLNKMDLFEEKLKKDVSIKMAFPEYDGTCEVEPSFQFISKKFKDVAMDSFMGRQFFFVMELPPLIVNNC